MARSKGDMGSLRRPRPEPPVPPRRNCKCCGTILSRLNREDFCFLCQRRMLSLDAAIGLDVEYDPRRKA